MQWEKLKPPEPDENVCCCECEACCRCEDLDEAFHRWLKGVPGGGGGFLRPLLDYVEVSLFPALLLLPVLLRLAALHLLLGLLVLTALPGLVLWYYYATHRRGRRTLFFLTLALYSLAYMYYLFLTEIVPRGGVAPRQVVTATAGMVLTLLALIHTKRSPGWVTASLHQAHAQETGRDPAPPSAGSLTPPSAGSLTPPSVGSLTPQRGRRTSEEWSWCVACRVWRPPRAGHCRTCGSCVQRLDHHCVWINSCVGQANHCSFLLTLCVFVLTSVYGIHLVLCSLCPAHYLMTALFYCPGVYNQPSSALCFTCAWYSSIITAGLVYLLLVQLLNISVNVTEREAQLALRSGRGPGGRGSGGRGPGGRGPGRLWGLVAEPGLYSRGFYHNWVEFLTMTDASLSVRCSHTHLV